MPPSISEPFPDPATEPASAPQIPAKRRFRWPADYYSSATPDTVLPRWATFGCAGLSVLVLLVVFAGGAYLSGGGLTQLMDFSFGVTLGEMRGMYTPAVTKAQKDTMEREIDTMRAGVREGKVPVQQIQPVLRLIQKVIKDEKLTPVEVEEVTAAARKTAPAPKSP